PPLPEARSACGGYSRAYKTICDYYSINCRQVSVENKTCLIFSQDFSYDINNVFPAFNSKVFNPYILNTPFSEKVRSFQIRFSASYFYRIQRPSWLHSVIIRGLPNSFQKG